MKNDLKEDIAIRSFAKTARTQAWFPALWLICAVAAALVDTGAGAPALSSFGGVSLAQAPKPSPQLSANPTTEELFRIRVFQEPLVVVGAEPSAAENSDLAAALVGYSKRSGSDDFSALTGFLNEHPNSSWNAALLTDLGLEFYHTCHYSLAIEAWSNAWSLAGKATDAKSVALVDRAFGELIKMDSRLGRMEEIERLLKSIGDNPRINPAGPHLLEAREALWSMKNRPEISFRCGPLALRSIRIALGLPGSSDTEILKSASTQKGCSLPYVAELSRKIGLNYQMAHRDSGDFVVPSVVHWKVGHYAAMVRRVGNLYELKDPTFGNSTWATKEALEAETSGYFLLPPGELLPGWRAVNESEGATVWGKGMTSGNDPQHITPGDLGGHCEPKGMAVPRIHLMDVNLNLTDNPLGYQPPVGPSVRFVLRYNQLDIFQPANFNYGDLGSLWTSDWFAYITDDPGNPLADVNLYVPGGGQRTYTDFDTNTQSFAYQQYDLNLLTRTSTNPISYQLLYGDGSRMIFSQSDGSIGSSRNIFLTQEIDPQGNALTFSYDTNLCLVAVQDAIGQTTQLTYGLPGTNFGTGLNKIIVDSDPYKLTSITDPFGRTATINYAPLPLWIFNGINLNTGEIFERVSTYAWGLSSNTDVIGITSQFGYTAVPTSTTVFTTNDIQTITVTYANIVSSLTTPYGTTTFYSTNNGNIRSMDIAYPDGSRERAEYNQTVTQVPATDPTASVPTGMLTDNTGLLDFRNTYFWDRTACALAYGDYTKARLFHFLHTENGALTSAALESYKSPLEGRIWFDYAGQSSSIIISSNTLPAHIGRVLDDGTTQLYTFAHNPFGHVISRIDPVGRTYSFTYDTNGIDLLEARQTRVGSDLLAKLTYNSQHRPLTSTDAAGQTTTFSWNARGQLLSITDAKNETTTYNYDANGYLLSIKGPLPGTNDTVMLSYDQFGRVQTLTDKSAYTVTCAYDNLDRITRLTYPDNTFTLFSYDRLDCSAFQDRAGRQTTFTHDSLRQLTSATDPLGRVTLFEWCRCGALKSLKDPLGRGTSWTTDVQGRPIVKQYADGSQVSYSYEDTTSRLQQVVDEKQQTTFYSYNVDDTLAMMSYGNAAVATPSVSFTYDSIYRRPISMADGTGTTTYSYIPMTPPGLGAGRLGVVDGSLTNSTTTYSYDELGRVVQTSVDGSLSTWGFDAGGRLISASNALGTFAYTYDGASSRLLSAGYPNGQTAVASYGSSLQDFTLQQLTYAVGANPMSQFTYGYDIDRMQITNWTQQAAGQAPSVFTLGYDAVDQLLSAVVTNSGSLANSFGYSYDFAGNRLTETIAGSTATATYNALNQNGTTSDPAAVARTNQWDAQNRLVAIAVGNQSVALGYDGASRLVSIDELQNGAQVSFRRFVWSQGRICEERDPTGTVITQRYFPQGFQLETGTNAGAYFYTRDHLGSIRELTDSNGNVRARYNYDPYGRRTKVSGDMDADFGFAGMFWSPEASLSLTHYRAYDANLGRWLSRDPLPNAEAREGPNLYAYVGNEPIRNNDPTGLAGTLPQFGLDTVTVTLVTMETTDPDALPQFVEDLGLAANRASQAAAPIAQKCSDLWETLDTTILPGDTPELPDIAVRAADLANKFYTTVTPADFEILTQANLQTEELSDVETEFYELASELANEEGISLQEAWSKLADLTKFDPNNWPQLTKIINMSNIDDYDLNPELLPR